MSGYNTIAFQADRCDGCGDCMVACAKAKSGTDDIAESRVRILQDGEAHGIALCRQCADPKCVANCPAAALAKDEASGAIGWDGDKCVNCLLCTVGCVYGGIAFNQRERHVVKCDTCDGAPRCVEACPTGALRYVEAARIYQEVGDLEDLFVPGLGGCQGCNTELLMRHALRRVGPEVVLATPPGCIPGMGSVGYNGKTGTKVPVIHPLLTNTAAMLTGMRRQYKRVGREVTAMALAGDGGAADVGFQSLSGAAERGEEILYVVVDNEGYMNTGAQRSSCTTYGAWTSTTPVGEAARGKRQDAKNLPVLMMHHKCAYVATASLAYMEDFYDKLDKAIAASRHGFAYLHVYSPCTSGWRYPAHQTLEVARRMVESNFVQLWEYDPAGGLRLSRPLDQPLPVRDYLQLLGRFRHLSDEQVAHIEQRIAEQVSYLEQCAAQARPGKQAKN